MRGDIYCLMTGNISLSDRMRDVLFDTACLALRGDDRRKRVKDQEMEGEVQTNFHEGLLGSVGGIKFRAIVETEFGTGFVEYIVRPVEAQLRNELEWAPSFGVESVFDQIN